MDTESRFMRRAKAGMRMLLEYPLRLGSHIAFTAIVLDSSVNQTAALDSRVRFYRSSLGRYSYVGRGTLVESATIGSFCSISGDCFIGGAGHPLSYPSTSPVFCMGGNILGINLAHAKFCPTEKTTIDNDVWIGHGAHIKAGVHIATGAVVGMGSVLTKDVGPYEIWAGNPAKLIRKRFSDSIITHLLESRWWDKSDTELLAMSSFFEGYLPKEDAAQIHYT